MRYYELMTVMVPEREEEGFSVALDRVNHYISERGGSVLRQERWGRLRRLAYPIKNFNEGHYVLTHMEMEPQNAKDLEARLMLSEDVLRHLLVKVDSIPAPKVEPRVEAVQISESHSGESLQEQAEGSLEPTDAVPTDKVETSTESQGDMPEDRTDTSHDAQVSGVEDTAELSTGGETETPSDGQVVVVEDNADLPAESQVPPIQGEAESSAEDQSIEPHNINKQETNVVVEESTENKPDTG